MTTRPVTGALNTFQKIMLQWNGTFPYNAVHVVCIKSAFDREKLESSIRKCLESAGFGAIRFEGNRFAFEKNNEAIPLAKIEADSTLLEILRVQIERELNIPFENSRRFFPFRFFVIAQGSFFYLGLVYFHAIAAADSITRLLQAMVYSYLGKNGANELVKDTCFKTGRLPKTVSLWHFLKWLVRYPAQAREFRSTFQANYRNASDFLTGFLSLTVNPETYRRLVEQSKLWQVTLNDLFLASLLKALSPLAIGRFQELRRKKISVASIINIRKDYGLESLKYFGLFLSSFRVSHAVPEEITMEKLAQDVHRQTTLIKKTKGYLWTLFNLRLTILLLKFFSNKQRKKYYLKYYPLWGGLTNVNLHSYWDGLSMDETPQDYLRAVSPSPATPIVFSVTMIRETLNIGVSFSNRVFSRDQAQDVAARFSNCLTQVASRDI